MREASDGLRSRHVAWSLYSVLLASFFVVCFFSLAEVYTMRHFNEKIEQIYQSSIDYAGTYWADRFYVANAVLGL